MKLIIEGTESEIKNTLNAINSNERISRKFVPDDSDSKHSKMPNPY